MQPDLDENGDIILNSKFMLPKTSILNDDDIKSFFNNPLNKRYQAFSVAYAKNKQRISGVKIS